MDPAAIEPGPLADDRFCLVCGYNLRGLDVEGTCPECGAPVSRSLQGNLLRFSSSEYLRALHLGVFLIIVAILGRIIVVVAGSGLTVLVQVLASNDPRWIKLAEAATATASLADFVLSLVLIGGWWLFSSPDPAILGRQTGDTPRRVIRISVIVLAAFELVTAMQNTVGFGGGTAAAPLLTTVAGAIAFAGIVAWIVKFFAAMVYLRWLAPRLPDRYVDDRARTLTWLGPVLLLLGCLIITYLVALVLYVNLLNRVRVDIRHIREQRGDLVAR